MKSKLIKTIVACLIIVGVSLGGYYGYKKYKSSKAKVTANSYITVSAKKMNMQVNIQGTGAAFAAVSREVYPNNSGNIKDLNVKVGDSVKQGDKLFTVESAQVSQNLSKAESNLEKQKLQLSKAKTDEDISMQNLAISDAQKDVDYASEQIDKMAVKSPINGVIVAVNNSNGDNVQEGKSVLSIIDPNSMKIKVAVDELDIEKVKLGQKAEIKFGAIKDKVYEGAVESISQVGNTTNDVTTYDVTVSIKDPTGVKLGMNANVNILVDSKENALTIPTEALVERNGNKYVMVQSDAESTSNAAQEGSTTKESKAVNTENNQSKGNEINGKNTQYSRNNITTVGLNGGKLVQIKTGLENENYVEVVEGLTEGQKILVSLPKSSSNNNQNMRNGLGGGFGGFGGNMGGDRNQSSRTNKKN